MVRKLLKFVKIIFYSILIIIGGLIPLSIIFGYFVDDGTVVFTPVEEIILGVFCAILFFLFLYLMIFAIKRLMNMNENDKKFAEKKQQSMLFEDLTMEVREEQRVRMEQRVEQELTQMFTTIPLKEEETLSQPVRVPVDYGMPVGSPPTNNKPFVQAPGSLPWITKQKPTLNLDSMLKRKQDYGITNDLAKLYGSKLPISSENKWLWGIVIVLSLIILGTLSIILVNKVWPRDRFSPEVDAAFVSGVVTSVVSMITIAITVGFTVVTSRKSNEALMNQSRASIRDDFLRQRMQIYPFLQKFNRTCRKLIRHHEVDEEKLVQNLNQFYEYYMEQRLYISRQIREQMILLFSTCIEEEEDWIGVKDFYQFTHASMLLDQIIDQELDLVAIDRDIRMLANQ